MVLSNALMSRTMKNVVDVLIADRTRIRIVNDNVLFVGSRLVWYFMLNSATCRAYSWRATST